jgi:AraC-like DNA-binding protein
MMSGSAKVATYEAMQRGVLPWQVTVMSPLKMVSGIVYSVATVLLLRRHRASMDDNYSSVERVSLRWVRWLVLSAAFIWAVGVSFDIAEPFVVVPDMLPDTVTAILMTLVVMGTGYMGLRQPEIFHFDGPAPAPALTLESELADPATAPAARYERSGLTERQRVTLERRLVERMEGDRPYLNADLTLADLAGRLGTTPHKLSEVLSSQVRLSFFDFVNGYRVREVQRRLLTEDAGRLTFLTLALDAGFASKSTFNAVFKKHTGLTPSAFRAGPRAAPPAQTTPS